MPIHHFTLTIEGPDLQDDVIIDRLFEVGCNAVLSAIADIERLDSVKVVRIDNVGLVAK